MSIQKFDKSNCHQAYLKDHSQRLKEKLLCNKTTVLKHALSSKQLYRDQLYKLIKTKSETDLNASILEKAQNTQEVKKTIVFFLIT